MMESITKAEEEPVKWESFDGRWGWNFGSREGEKSERVISIGEGQS